MDDDQQFCLRWNNHQSTLVSVFDNLLENGTLVDCTLFAEGKFLKAHKVVLSACSPYFESLLTQEYDKHPIFILKDVKFQELKAMMDYMYRGEVNISQDQLAALLKAAESLQIKGLSDSRSKENDTRKAAPPPPAKTPPPAPTLPRVQGLTIEQRKTPKLSANTDVTEESRSRDGSMSPVPRKRKKPRRRTSNSQDGVLNDNHDASSSSESHSNPAANAIAIAQAGSAQNINIPSASSSASLTLPTVPLASTSKLTDVPEQLQLQLDTKSELLTRQTIKLPQSSVSSDSIPQVPIKEKLETHSELILEPKSEYIEEEMNEDSVEDLTLEDDDDVSQMEQEMDHARPGPSHGSTDGSQGFGGWHMSGNQAQDEVFLAAQEAVGAHRDSQAEDLSIGRVSQWNHWPAHLTVPMMLLRESMEMKSFSSINKIKSTSSLNKSASLSVQLATGFECSACGRLYKLKSSLRNHQKWECGKEPQFKCPFCVYKAKQKMHVARHMERMHKPKDLANSDAAVVKDEVNVKDDQVIPPSSSQMLN